MAPAGKDLSEPSSRQRRAALQDEARREHEKILDVFQCVDRLHGLDISTLKRIVMTTGDGLRSVMSAGPLTLNVPRTEHGPAFKADAELLLHRLPLHIMACWMAQQPNQNGGWLADVTPATLHTSRYYEHALHGMDLLGNLCCIGDTFPKIAKAAAMEDFQVRAVDVATLILVAVAGSEAETIIAAVKDPARGKEALDWAALVPSALRVVVLGLQGGPSKKRKDQVGQWQSLCAALLRKPRCDLLLDAMFDAVRTLYRMVHAAMVAPDGSASVYELAYHAGCAMETITTLCAVPMLYQRLAMKVDKFKPVLRLIAAGMVLHSAPFAPPPYIAEGGRYVVGRSTTFSTIRGQGAVELLTARSMALLLCVSSHGRSPFMDHIASDPACKVQAEFVMDRAFTMASLVLERPLTSVCPVLSTGEGQLALNTLQLAEMCSDDSNYRRTGMLKLAGPVASVLSLPVEDFKSAWCAGREALALHSNDLAINGQCILVTQGGAATADAIQFLAAFAADRKIGALSSLAPMRAKHAGLCALQRSIVLYKLLANLHLFNEDLEPEADRNLFAMGLVRELILRAGPVAGELGANGSAQALGEESRPVQEAVKRLGLLDEYVKAARAVAAKKDGEDKADILVTVTDIQLIASLLKVLCDA